MKKILTNLVKQIRRFASNSSGHDTEPIPDRRLSSDFKEKAGFESHTHIPPSPIVTTLPDVPTHQRGSRGQPPLKPTEARPDNSINHDSITRQELQREVDLLRRLIESRK